MKELSFFGQSDDCREMRGVINDEDYHPAVRITSKDGSGLYVIWRYLSDSELGVRNGCWMVGFAQLDEDIPIPEWASNIRLDTYSNGYSVKVTILLEDDIELQYEWMESD